MILTNYTYIDTYTRFILHEHIVLCWLNMKVLCGADLETRNCRSGFPISSSPSDTPDYAEYLKSGWNLNNTAKLPGSLLAFENSETCTASLPKVYVGMCLSSLCWVRSIISLVFFTSFRF